MCRWQGQPEASSTIQLKDLDFRMILSVQKKGIRISLIFCNTCLGFRFVIFFAVSSLCTLCLDLAECGFDCDVFPPLDIVSLIKMDEDIGCNTLHVSESHM